MAFSIMSRDSVGQATMAEVAKRCEIQTRDIEDMYAATSLQMATMAASAKLCRAHNDVHQYTIALGSMLDLDRYCHSLRDVVASNAILRTRLVECGDHGLTQVVVRQAQETKRYATELDLASVLSEEKSIPMGLNSPLFRTALIGRTMVLTLHHAIFDQWSSMALSSDVMDVYQGRSPPSRAPFKDFVAYGNAINTSEAQSFWAGQYHEPVHDFPSVPPEYTPSGNRTIDKDMMLDDGRVPISISRVPSLIEAAWILTAASYTQKDSVLYGFVFSGRSPALNGIETTLGPTIANIPVQAALPTTVGALLKERTQSRRTLNANSAFLQYGLNRIATVSEASRIATRFQTLINIRATEVTVADSIYGRFNSLEAVPAPYALTLECGVVPHGVTVRARYDGNIIEDRQMRRILQQMEAYLLQLKSVQQETKLVDLRHLNDGDWAEILVWNADTPDPVDQCLHHLFASQVQRHPSALAIDASDGQVSFLELNALSSTVALRLREQHQIKAEDPVVLLFGKSMWAIVGILAVLKTGATCVPVDPLHPRARKQAIFAKSRARVILVAGERQNELKDEFADCETTVLSVSDENEAISVSATRSDPPTECSSSSAAYIMFTSGSTGDPKGVVLEHGNLSSALCAFSNRISLRPGHRMLQFASLVWDVSIQETIGTLIHGGCVCILSEGDRESNLAGYIESSHIDCAILTPTVARTLSPWQVPGLKVLVLGGERIDSDTAETWGSRLRLIHGWGLTETGICSTAADLTPHSTYSDSIGTSLGCATWIVDTRNVHNCVPIGALGELVVEGPGVARGYLEDEENTTGASFIPPPAWATTRIGFLGRRRFHRTGDLAKYNADGSLHLVGRMDGQVKVRGQRFQLEEVEHVLNGGHHGLEAFVGMADGDLVGVLSRRARVQMFTAAKLASIDDIKAASDFIASVESFASETLPFYMVPRAWLVVEQLPRSTSGKLDRKRICEWLQGQDIVAAKQQRHARTKTATAPRPGTEQLLQGIWSAVTGVGQHQIFRETSFIDVGGDSILAMMVASRCRREGLGVTIASLLRCRSLTAVAEECEVLVSETAGKEEELASTFESSADGGGNLSEVDLDSIGLAPQDVESVSPCTPMQEGLLLRQMQSRQSVTLSSRILVQVTSRCGNDCIDASNLRKAWTKLCDSYGILRTVFANGHDGSFRQIVLKKSQPWTEETSGNIDNIRKHAASAVSTLGAVHHRFLFACAADIAWIRIDISHALVDPFTISEICKRLGLAYEGSVPATTSISASLGFYARHMQLRRRESLRHWNSFLSGVFPTLIRPITRAESSRISGKGQVIVPVRHLARMACFCKQYNVTSANVLQVAWAAVLHRLTLNTKPTFGCIVDERHAIDGASSIMGPLLAMTVCKVDFTQKGGIAAVLSRVRDEFATGLQNTALSLAELHDSLELSASPLFNTALSLVRAAPQVDSVTSRVAVTALSSEDDNEYAIMVKAASSDTIEAWLEYDGTQIAPSYASAIASTFAATIEIVLNCASEPLEGLMRGKGALSPPPEPFSSWSIDVALDIKRKAAVQMRLPKSAIEDIMPCVPSQQSLMAASIAKTQHNMAQYVFEVVDQAIVGRLRRAWERLIAAHASLRTWLVSLDGLGTLQVVTKLDVQWTADDDLNEYLEWDREISVSYGNPCCRLGMVSRPSGGSFLVVSIHRAVCDDEGWSRLMNDLDASYHERALSQRASPSAMVEFISSQDSRESDRFWTRRLQGFEAAAAFPESAHRLLTADQAKRKVISTNMATPMTMGDRSIKALFSAAWALCMSRISGNRLCTFGLNVDVRDALPPSIEAPACGLTSVTVPFLVDVDPDSTGEALTTQVDTLLLDMLPFVFYQFHDDNITGKGMNAALTCPCNAVLAVKIKPRNGLAERKSAFTASFATPVQVAELSRPSLLVTCEVGAKSSHIDFDFDSSTLSSERADLLLLQYVHAINQLIPPADTPLSRLKTLSEHEMNLLETCNNVNPAATPACVYTSITNVVRERPTAIAVSSWDGDISYQELETISEIGAAKLRNEGMRKSSVVPVLYEKSASLIVAYLAILKAGGAVLPLDATQPGERLKEILRTGCHSIAVTSRALRCRAEELLPNVLDLDLDDWKALSPPETIPPGVGLSAVDPEAACYVIYTSGSTGAPKGITVSHSNLSTAAAAFIPQLGITAETRTLQATNCIFDAAMGDIFFTLLAGGCLCMPREEQLREDMSRAINNTGANLAFITPTMARLFSPCEVPFLRTLALIGESVTRETAETWAPHVRLLNCYGPAETTILTSCNHLSVRNINRFANVGRPPASRYWIVDPANADILLPLGCPGELLIEGPMVARGYIGDARQTAERFITPPAWFKEFSKLETSHRFYKTGDIAMQETDGSVVIQGRSDTQVKLRGRRIELGDVEYHLRRVADASWNVIVESCTPSCGDKEPVLVAFMAQSTKDSDLSESSDTQGFMLAPPLGQSTGIHQKLLKALPDYMVPTIFIHLTRIPRSSSGKTDRKRLRMIGAALSRVEIKAYSVYNTPKADIQGDTRSGTEAATIENLKSGLEIQMCRLWSETLDIPMSSVSNSDNFFALGGNSIRAMRLVSAARKTGLPLSLKQVFTAPDLSRLVATLPEAPNASVDLNSMVDITGARAKITADRSPRSAVPDHCQALVESMVPAAGIQRLMTLNSLTKWPEDRFSLEFAPALDTRTLQQAIESVFQHHEILRTVLVKERSQFYQVVLKDRTCDWEQVAMLPKFHLQGDGRKCTALRLEIHHAFYDRLSLNLVLRDIDAAYHGLPLSDGPRFDDWAAYVAGLDFTKSKHFWARTLVGSKSMTYVGGFSKTLDGVSNVRQVQGSVPVHSLDDQATVLRAALAVVLSQLADDARDIVFAQATSIRSLNVARVEQVRGPCVNLLPVRARAGREASFERIKEQLRAQAEAALPHHHLDLDLIVSACTSWPSDTLERLGTVLVVQDVAQEPCARIGGSGVTIKGESSVGDIAEMWIVATPHHDQVAIDVSYSNGVSTESAEWVLSSLSEVIDWAGKCSWSDTIPKLSEIGDLKVA